MIYLKGIYDSNLKKLMIEFRDNLLENHYEILETCFKKSVSRGSLPRGSELKNLNEGRCLITLNNINLPGSDNMGNGEQINAKMLPKNLTDQISKIIEEFKNEAIKTEFSTTEFIPLSGYPLKDLQKDIIEAIRNKRNFCVIDKYSEYLRFSRGETTKLNQKKVNYICSEYSDIAIYIHEGNMKKLREMYKDELIEFDWG